MGPEQVDSIAFVDIETTGLDKERDRIIEIAVVILKFGATKHDVMCSLVNPGVEVSPFIVQFTGITQAMLAQAPGPEALNEFLDFIGNRPVAAYNVEFDAGVVVAEAHRLGRKFDNDRLCVMELTMELHPRLRSYRLGDVCEAFDIDADEPVHRALGDVKRAIHLWLALRRGQQPKPESVRALEDYAVVVYYRMDGLPFLVWGWRTDQVDEEPRAPLFRHYVSEYLNGEYRKEILGKGLCRADADSLKSTLMRKHADTLLNTVNPYRRLLYPNYDNYHEAERQARAQMELGRAREQSDDPDGAVEAYQASIRHSETCAGLQLEEGLFGEVTRDMNARSHVGVALKAIDRITLSLCRAGRAPEAKARAEAFFKAHPEVNGTGDAQAVRRRIEKAIRRLV